MDEEYLTNLLRYIGAQMHLQTGLLMAQDMFGKGYHQLGAMEKIAVDQAVNGMLGANYRSLTPELLKNNPLLQAQAAGNA
jgi:hypothetical protein